MKRYLRFLMAAVALVVISYATAPVMASSAAPKPQCYEDWKECDEFCIAFCNSFETTVCCQCCCQYQPMQPYAGYCRCVCNNGWTNAPDCDPQFHESCGW